MRQLIRFGLFPNSRDAVLGFCACWLIKALLFHPKLNSIVKSRVQAHGKVLLVLERLAAVFHASIELLIVLPLPETNRRINSHVALIDHEFIVCQITKDFGISHRVRFKSSDLDLIAVGGDLFSPSRNLMAEEETAPSK